MYNLPYFNEKDGNTVRRFMEEHPFVVLCGCNDAGEPVATQVPVLLKERDGGLFLQGHMMRNTDHHKAFVHHSSVLALFMGPHTYVSASWYTDPQQGSTWNYMTVHARGTITFLDEAALPAILKETTSHFENNIHSPSLFEHLPQEYVQRLIKAIIAFEIKVNNVENVFKLSQNRDEASYHNIIQQLQQQPGDAQQIAAEMQQRATRLFQ
jgi:transcriptional regulator